MPNGISVACFAEKAFNPFMPHGISVAYPSGQSISFLRVVLRFLSFLLRFYQSFL